MPKFLPPLGFSRVIGGKDGDGDGNPLEVYRSAYPANKCFPFITKLQLKTVICLTPNDLRSDFREYCQTLSINLMEFDIRHNQEPFLVMSEDTMESILDAISCKENQPVMVFCTSGKVKTSTIIACLRKRLDWSLSSIIAEFELFSDSEGGIFDLHFIENYRTKQRHRIQYT
jgi:tyrosine-protein phosphatase SIW14